MMLYVFGFLIAPLVPFIPFVFGGMNVLGGILLIGAVVAYIPTALIAMPLFFFNVRKKPHLQRGLIYAGFGAVIGLIGGLVLPGGGTSLVLSLWTGTHGFLSGLVFWLIIRKKIQQELGIAKDA